MLTIGLSFHRQGRFDDAGFSYRQVLKVDPQNPDAYHLLGLVAHYQGRSDIALYLMKEAISLKPDVGDYYANLGLVLLDNGRLNEAALNTRHALKINKDDPNVVNNFEIIYRDMERVNDKIEKMISRNKGKSINIYIKCHSRLAYLDRCIISIKLNVIGYKDIIILNDGIGDSYINTIREKHPDIQIRNSKKIDLGLIAAPRDIHLDDSVIHNDIGLDPSRFWVREIEKDPNHHFLLVEEDCWFSSKIDLNDIKHCYGASHLSVVRLLSTVNDHPIIIESRTQLNTKLLNNEDIEIYGKSNKIFAVANAIFQTDFWTYAYSNLRGWADEHKARRHVCEYLIACMERNIPVFVGSLGNQVMTQSVSSTVREDCGGPGIEVKINPHLYNGIINELWSCGDFDCMENFPYDFSEEYLANAFSKKISNDQIREWIYWKEKFTAMYS